MSHGQNFSDLSIITGETITKEKEKWKGLNNNNNKNFKYKNLILKGTKEYLQQLRLL